MILEIYNQKATQCELTMLIFEMKYMRIYMRIVQQNLRKLTNIELMLFNAKLISFKKKCNFIISEHFYQITYLLTTC